MDVGGAVVIPCPLYADGYVSLKSLELNIKEMLELGKKPSQTAGLAANEGDTVSLG